MTEKEKFIILTDNDCIKKSDAIIMLEGDGYNRCSKVSEIFSAGYARTVIFSGGVDDKSYGSFPYDIIVPVLLRSGIPESAIIHEPFSKNTKEQAEEIISMAGKNNWRKLILVGSHYHQYRAYLTFLKVVLEKMPDLQLFNASAANLSWFEETGWGKRIDLLNGEFERIEKYASMGHLASYSQAIEYQEWKEKQQ